MEESIFSRVTGTLRPATLATARGWVRRRVRDEVYPAIAPQAAGVVSGVVYFDLPPEAWARLDAFEGEMYERVRIGVRGADGREWKAFSYALRPGCRHLFTGDDWSFEEFRSRDLAAFTGGFRGFGALES